MADQNIQQLADAAFKYGPFFFSVLFVIFLTRWAYKKYNAAVAHVPALDQRDKDINRTMFLTTFFFGIVLVVVSIVWWWWFKPGVYFFRGEIRNLQPQEELASDLYYLRREVRAVMSPEEDLLRNEHFVIFQTHPFKQGQQFELDYAKNHQRRIQLWITYDPGDEEPVYEVSYDQNTQQTAITHVSQPKPINVGMNLPAWLERVVLAAEPAQVTTQAKEHSPAADEDTKLIQLLRDPRSDVASKLNAVDRLSAENPVQLRQQLLLDDGEPLALTIFDLTQHSDAELASKATLLAKRLDVDGYLVDALSSDNATNRERAERILLRISRVHAQAILRRVNVSKNLGLRNVSQDVASGAKTRILKPTASVQGDRYYVKASWNPSDQTVAACLTQLFNRTLETSRTLDEERAAMTGKSQRFVYWYSKDWALSVSDDIRKCGATAEMVHPY
jgi:hypothetical protein